MTPSTPAVFFPRLSCVTLRTARYRAALDLSSNRWSRWTVLTSPRREALKIRVWSFATSTWNCFHGSARQSSFAVMTCGLLLATLHSVRRGPRQPIPGITPGLRFWDHLAPAPAWVAPVDCGLAACSALDHAESGCGVTSFLLFVLRSRRAALSTGFGVGEHRSVRRLPATYPLPFGPANIPLGQVQRYGGFAAALPRRLRLACLRAWAARSMRSLQTGYP